MLIRGFTWSKWAHVGFVLDDNSVIEAVWPKVRRVPFELAVSGYSAYTIVDFKGFDSKKVIEAAKMQIGKPYDLSGVLGIAMHRDWQKQDSWSCAELVSWCFQQSGKPIFRTEGLHKITPQHLWMLNYPEVVCQAI